MARAKTRIDASGWKLTEEMRAWAKREVPFVDVEKQLVMFMDYWLAHGKAMFDWDATFRNWMRRAPEFSRPVNRYSQFERSRAPAPTRTIAPPIQPREHPLFRKPS